jgi:hypothetical protein
MTAQPIFKTTSPEYLAIALQKQQAIAKANEKELAAFEETAARTKEAIRKATLMHYLPAEQAAAIVKSMVNATDAEFTAVVATFASTTTKPLLKAAEVKAQPVDLTRAILEAKYGKK